MQGQRFLYDNAGMISFFNMKFSSEIFAVSRKCLEGLSLIVVYFTANGM